MTKNVKYTLKALIFTVMLMGTFILAYVGGQMEHPETIYAVRFFTASLQSIFFSIMIYTGFERTGSFIKSYIEYMEAHA